MTDVPANRYHAFVTHAFVTTLLGVVWLAHVDPVPAFVAGTGLFFLGYLLWDALKSENRHRGAETEPPRNRVVDHRPSFVARFMIHEFFELIEFCESKDFDPERFAMLHDRYAKVYQNLDQAEQGAITAGINERYERGL